MKEMTLDQRLTKLHQIHRALTRLLTEAKAREGDASENCGALSEALEAIEGVLQRSDRFWRGAEPFWMQDIRIAQKAIESQRRAIARPCDPL